MRDRINGGANTGRMPAGYVPPERRQGGNGERGPGSRPQTSSISVGTSTRLTNANKSVARTSGNRDTGGNRIIGGRGDAVKRTRRSRKGSPAEAAPGASAGARRRGVGPVLRWMRSRLTRTLRINRRFQRHDGEDEAATAADALAAATGGDSGGGGDVIASCVESNGSKRVLHVATHGCRQLNQHVYSTINRNYGSVVRQLLSFNEWASSFLLPDGYPHSVTASFTPYMQWRAVQYFFGGALGVFTTRSLMASLGVGQAGSKAAALNWVLKDGAGRLGRLVFARYGRQLDNDLKQFRFLGDLLMECGAAMELSTCSCPVPFCRSLA